MKIIILLTFLFVTTLFATDIRSDSLALLAINKANLQSRCNSFPINVTNSIKFCYVDASSKSSDVISANFEEIVKVKKIKLGEKRTIKKLTPKTEDLVQTDDQIYVPKEKKERIFSVELMTGRLGVGWGVIGKNSGLNLRGTTGPVLIGTRDNEIFLLPFVGYQGLYSFKDDNSHFITAGIGVGYCFIGSGLILGSINGSLLTGWHEGDYITGGRIGIRAGLLDIIGCEIGVSRFPDNWGAEILFSFDIVSWTMLRKSGDL